MKFNQLAQLYETLEKTSSYNQMRDTLSQFFKKTTKQDIEQTTYLTLGQIASHFADINIGMADKMVVKAIAKAGKEQEHKIYAQYKKQGDIGKTAEQHAGKGNLTVKQVFDTLHKIAQTTGQGSQEQKIKLLSELLKQANPQEAKYIARLTIGDLRLGIGDKTILDALAIAYTGNKNARKELEHAYNICPDAGTIAKTLATKGLLAIKKIGVKIGIPIQSMLCQRIKKIEDVKQKIGYPLIAEEKYDGERIQIHKQGTKIKLYSRRLEDITHQFPDVITAVNNSVKAKNCVLDSEAMPTDQKGNLLKFQILMQRRRKHDIEEYAQKIPVVLFVFDILYLDGKSLIHEQYKTRYKTLQKTIKQTNKVKLALQKQCTDSDCIEELFNKTVDHGGEGIIIKKLTGTYQAGTRGWNWIKWKPEYVKGLRDTFDLVIVGAYLGKGRRAGKYGALLCAIYDDKTDKFLTFCKLGTGFTDKTLSELSKILTKTDHKPARLEVNKTMQPDVWVEPKKVAEVAGAEITKSPNHTTGYALRFPRFITWRQKTPEQATTLKEIMKMVRK